MSPGIHLEEISCFTAGYTYLLALTLFVVVGAGLMYINNVAAVGKSFNLVLALSPLEAGPHDALVNQYQKLHVGTLSLASFIGRVLTGLVSDWAHAKYHVSYPLWLVVCSGLMLVTFVVSLQVQTLNTLIYISIACGIAYGSVWTITPVLIGKFFGQRNFAKNWGWMTMVPIISIQLYSFLFGHFYDKNQVDGNCKGLDCFYLSHEIAAYTLGIAWLSSLALWRWKA